MGPCGSKSDSKEPRQQNANKNKDQIVQKEKEPQGFFALIQFKFHQINPFSQPKPATEKKTGTLGDNITQTQQSTKPANQFVTIQQQIQPGTIYKDPDFTSSIQSISLNPDGFKISKEAFWKRPKDFLDPSLQPVLFQDKIEPNDIKQGGLGDCYFLSSISALAEYPGLIEKLFITKTYQETGLHSVWLCHDGEFIQVVLDDTFPCSEKGGPLFSKCNGNELWVLFLEKAYSKIYGSYEKIESGLAGHALRDLTGAPYEYFIRDDDESKDIDKCWKFIYDNQRKHYVLAASSESNVKGIEVENQLGIVSQHCYAILDAQEVTAADYSKDRIIKLRNPWGHKEWTGSWGDDSGKWTPELRQKLNIEKKDDGIFWISIVDFCKEFNQVCCCKIKPDYQYSAIKLNEIPKKDLITKRVCMMRVYTQGHFFITLCQKDKRAFAKEPGNKYSYSLARIIIGRIDANTNEISTFSGQTMDSDRDCFVECDLEPADYAIYIEVEWSQPNVRELVLTSYGQSATSFTEPQMNTESLNQILDGLITVHQHFTDQDKIHSYESDIKKVSGILGGYVYFLYQNKSKISTLTETLKMTSRKNLVICPPQTNSDTYVIECPPNTNILIKYRVTSDDGGAYSYATSTSSSLQQNYSNEDLKQLAKSHPTKVTERAMNEQPLNVSIMQYNFSGGVAFLYTNQSGKTYKETLKLKLENMKVEDFNDPNDIKIELASGKEFLLVLRTIDTTKGTSYRNSASYGLQ